MRADISGVARAFMAKAPHKPVANTHSDGKRYLYHGNIIAEWRDDGLWVTLAGYPTVTTMHRLSALEGVGVYTHRRNVKLNGKPWDGDWVKVDGFQGSEEAAQLTSIWNPNGKWANV